MRIRAGLVGALVLLGACTDANSATSSSSATTVSSDTTSDPATETSPSSSATSDSTRETTVAPSEIEVGAILGGEGSLTATVVQILPHDFNARTQGLAWEGRFLIESTGAYGSSERRFLSPVSAQTSQEKFLVPELFGSDLAIVGEVGIQLSGREGIATTFDITNLNETAQVRYEGEGWGLCLQGEELVMSDNTGTLVRRNPQTLAIVAPQPSPENLTNLRALECAKQWIWAVVGDTNTIAVINAESGLLEGSIDTTDLVPNTAGPNDALAAIAYNPSTDTFYVAGRRWGVFYEISVEFPAS